MGINSLKNRDGFVLPLILLLSVVVLGGFYYEQSRYLSLKKGLLRASARANGRVVERFLSSHVNCTLTQAQSCVSPISVLQKSGAAMLSAGVNTLGAFRLQAKCRGTDRAILVQYIGVKEANFDKASEFMLCSPP